MDRVEALEVLLEPIVIRPEMPMEGARIVVLRRTEKVRNVVPFLTEEERKLALKWLKNNSFDHLWDDVDGKHGDNDHGEGVG